MSVATRRELELEASRARERLRDDLGRLTKRKADMVDLDYEWTRTATGASRLGKRPVAVFLGASLVATAGVVALGLSARRRARRHPLLRRGRVALAAWREPERLLGRKGPPSVFATWAKGLVVTTLEVLVFAAIARMAGARTPQ